MYSAVPTPQPDSMAQLTPMATAPPPGSVLATAVDPRFTTAASRSRRDGSTAPIIIQVASWDTAAAAPISRMPDQLIAVRLAQTPPYEAIRGSAKPKTPATISTDSTPAMTFLRAGQLSLTVA